VDTLLGNDCEKTAIQPPFLGNNAATDTNATIPRRKEDTKIMGGGVPFAFHDEVLEAGQVRR
jgi:hypothetical protein